MKHSILAIAALIFLAGTACQQQTGTDKDKKAIVQVLNAEGRVFANFDIDSLALLHVQDSLDTRWDGTQIFTGWDDIRKLYEQYIESNRKDTVSRNIRNLKENIIMKVTGNTAWVICKNIWKWEEDAGPQEWDNRQIAFFEKVDGNWKFSFNAFVPNQEEVQKNIETAVKYHKLNPDDIDDILTEDFIGHNEFYGNTWTREDHKNYWSRTTAEDKILSTIGDDNGVAVRFVRTMDYNGKMTDAEGMQQMRFVEGKIAELWEYWENPE